MYCFRVRDKDLGEGLKGKEASESLRLEVKSKPCTTGFRRTYGSMDRVNSLSVTFERSYF